MIKRFFLAVLLCASASLPVSAEYIYGFGSAYLDHQSWDHGFKPIKDGSDGAGRNQYVIGIEGGAGFTWGEIYGFYDYENIGKGTDERKSSFKGTGHIYLGESGASIYGQVYNHSNNFQSEQNRSIGFGYTNLKGDGWFFKPWVGVHEISSWDSFSPNENISGKNGFMLGWVGMYSFSLSGQNFNIINWNEIEFNRGDEYSINQGGDTGINGAIMLTTNVSKNIKLGIQYRYFKNKLGVYGSTGGEQNYGDAIIYRVQYDF